MKAYTISSMQQVGVGTSDFKKSWDWYIKTFGFDVKILEDDTIAERMLPYTGGQAQKRHACIAINLQGGSGLEIWQYSKRKPEPPKFNINIGDLGIFSAKIKCRNIREYYKGIIDSGEIISKLSKTPGGLDTFYIEDPYNNIFQIIEDDSIYIEDNKLCGGVVGAMVGVRDMDRSVIFYSNILGYNKVIYDETDSFDDWKILNGGNERYRRVLLGKNEASTGPFSGLLGNNTIELVQSLDHIPRKIYEDRYWGDPGFIQICYDIKGMDALKEFCASKGYPFTVDSCPDGEIFDMGEASGRFSYIEDPDGTLIEFVETYKIPLISKLGLNVSLNNRTNPLPKLIFKILGLVSRQKIIE